MKRHLMALLALTIAGCAPCWGQQLLIGSKAPELKVARWSGDRIPQSEDRVRLIEFFYSSAGNASRRITDLDSLAARFGQKIAVILVVKESAEKLASAVPSLSSARHIYVAFDDEGKSFSDYGVRFVPYSVIVDRRGRISWLGNPSSLTEEDIYGIIR